MSCLFESLSKFVNIHPTDLRQKICDFLQTNPRLMDGMSAEEIAKFDSDLPLDRYVFIMRQCSTMGGAIEIKAFCSLFYKNVKVYSQPNQKIIEFMLNENNEEESEYDD